MKDFKNILVTHGYYKEPKHYTHALHIVSPKNILTHTAALKWVVNYFEISTIEEVLWFSLTYSQVIIRVTSICFQAQNVKCRLNPGYISTWSKNHVMSSKLCCDISRVLHEMLTSFIRNNIKYFAYLALYDEEQHSKLIYIVSSTQGNDSDSVTFLTFVVTSVTFNWV